MSPNEVLREKIRSRDAAQRLLSRLTTGAVIGAVAGVGVLGFVSAQTIPGKSSSAAASSTSSASSAASGWNLSLSAGSVRSSSGSAVAVTGGS